MSTPSVSLKDLLTQYENASTALDQADGVLSSKNDKLAAAQAEQAAAATADKDAATAYNAIVDQFVAALTASKRPG